MSRQIDPGIFDTTFETNKWIRTVNLMLEDALHKVQVMEDHVNQKIQETTERVNYLSAKVKERSLSDLKIEALIERHNQIVQSFDLRLTKAHRLVENQALQLSKQQELIDDARRQIEKLKRL